MSWCTQRVIVRALSRCGQSSPKCDKASDTRYNQASQMIQPRRRDKAVVRRFYEVFRAGDMSILEEVLSSNFVDHNPFAGLPPGPEGLRQVIGTLRAAFPDSGISVEDMLAEGDKVAVRAEMTGTHRGEFMGIPATGNKIAVTGISIYKVAGGKITDHWEQMDAMGMMQQLGAMPA